VDGNLTKFRGAVITEPTVVVAEVAEGKTGEVMFVGGVAEGTEVGVMGRLDENPPARLEQTVEFFHGADDVSQMLHDMNGAHGCKRPVAKRVRKLIEVAQHIGSAGGVAVNAEGIRIFADTAANVENFQSTLRARRVR